MLAVRKVPPVGSGSNHASPLYRYRSHKDLVRCNLQFGTAVPQMMVTRISISLSPPPRHAFFKVPSATAASVSPEEKTESRVVSREDDSGESGSRIFLLHGALYAGRKDERRAGDVDWPKERLPENEKGPSP
ncbi:hypothetical protein MPTK1_2g16520 [Marchantia polymorpha subsp. ruderalis]|uniref:Uncharacterized protein n=1 Tax=Marchantia polymorpha TaxID=3197 RepID=A0A2R6W9Q4_MARPO|nr:hypothetical protein MARPO_0122s0012 [Marchantia polymorpha]BBN02590.1 hypothetical protein Mp_2g16520 [Marchantia polymorpha subsp. ruderalis]|eukprot:PTQ30579.1 hypothetical protein MARPO_0122s0012 [Marchantia polymorpha]